MRSVLVYWMKKICECLLDSSLPIPRISTSDEWSIRYEPSVRGKKGGKEEGRFKAGR